jgi:hypothetical protein
MKIKWDELAGKFMAWCLIVAVVVAVGSVCIGGVIILVDRTVDIVQEVIND